MTDNILAPEDVAEFYTIGQRALNYTTHAVVIVALCESHERLRAECERLREEVRNLTPADY